MKYIVVEFETSKGVVKREKHLIPEVWEFVSELLIDGYVVVLEKGEKE